MIPPLQNLSLGHNEQRAMLSKSLLDFDASSQVFKQAILTGHPPGMIQIPKFDEVSKFNGKEIPEDNIVSQLQHYYKRSGREGEAKSVALGLGFNQRSYESLFDTYKTS